VHLDTVKENLFPLFGPISKLPCGTLSEVPTTIEDNLIADFNRSLVDANFEMDLLAWEPQFNESISSSSSRIDVSRLMSDLIGTCATQVATEKNWREFSRFIKPLDIWDFLSLLEQHPDLESVTASELGTLVDLTLLSWSVWAQGLSTNLQVVEIGGGYGRLAHALFSTFPAAKVQYRLIDVIPSVMALAAQHMKNLLGDQSVAVLLENDFADVKTRKVEIIPAWNREVLSRITGVQILINIESFQEMGDDFVKYWFNFAETAISSNGFFYISNSRSYINQNPWPIPSNWKVKFQFDIPRMWTLDHPTTVVSPSPGLFPDRYGELMKRALSSVWKSTSNILIPDGSRGHRLLLIYLRIIRFLG
jgi:putative sugar O-methyltransferase